MSTSASFRHPEQRRHSCRSYVLQGESGLPRSNSTNCAFGPFAHPPAATAWRTVPPASFPLAMMTNQTGGRSFRAASTVTASAILGTSKSPGALGVEALESGLKLGFPVTP